MTMPPERLDSTRAPGFPEGDASGTIPLQMDTVRPISKRADPAWASEEWVTAVVPVFLEPTALEAGQEEDIVAAVFSALGDDHVRVQRVVDALTERLTKKI